MRIITLHKLIFIYIYKFIFRCTDGKDKPGLIANFLLEKDSISPAELAKRIAEAVPTPNRRGRGREIPAPNLSEEEQALLDLNEGIAVSDVNPLHEEFRKYINLARALPQESRSTLGFWKSNSARLPILSKVARRVLAISGTSFDVEILFSRAGLICTALINRLAPKTIQCLSSLHYYYAAEDNPHVQKLQIQEPSVLQNLRLIY